MPRIPLLPAGPEISTGVEDYRDRQMDLASCLKEAGVSCDLASFPFPTTAKEARAAAVCASDWASAIMASRDRQLEQFNVDQFGEILAPLVTSFEESCIEETAKAAGHGIPGVAEAEEAAKLGRGTEKAKNDAEKVRKDLAERNWCQFVADGDQLFEDVYESIGEYASGYLEEILDLGHKFDSLYTSAVHQKHVIDDLLDTEAKFHGLDKMLLPPQHVEGGGGDGGDDSCSSASLSREEKVRGAVGSLGKLCGDLAAVASDLDVDRARATLDYISSAMSFLQDHLRVEREQAPPGNFRYLVTMASTEARASSDVDITQQIQELHEAWAARPTNRADLKAKNRRISASLKKLVSVLPLRELGQSLGEKASEKVVEAAPASPSPTLGSGSHFH